MTTEQTTTMEERFQKNIPPRGMHPLAGDFDENGHSEVYEFGYKVLKSDEVFTVVDWFNIEKFIKVEITRAVTEDRAALREKIEKLIIESEWNDKDPENKRKYDLLYGRNSGLKDILALLDNQ